MNHYLGLIELLVFSAIVFGFGFWQLRATKRDSEKAEAEERARRERLAAAAPPPTPEPPTPEPPTPEPVAVHVAEPPPETSAPVGTVAEDTVEDHTADTEPSTGSWQKIGNKIVLSHPDGQQIARSDFIRDRYYKDGVSRSDIVKELKEKFGHEIPYQTVRSDTAAETDPRQDKAALSTQP